MERDRILDPDLAHRLVLHEARAQQTPTRELRDLGDAWLLHDPNDAEPFWNRVVAPRWPADASAFDRRLDEVITLFAALGRLPHVRPLPYGGSPADLAERLEAAGFERLAADRRMVLVDPEVLMREADAAASRAGAETGGVVIRISRQGRPPRSRAAGAPGPRYVDAEGAWPERRRWAAAAALVLSEAFGVDIARRIALENDALACISRPGCAMVLVEVDGEPASIARRISTPDGSYLSSIGTRPAFRGRGLGTLATLVAARDALDAGGDLVHLAVELDNDAARRLYERLGFAVIGDPTPDMLLH